MRPERQRPLIRIDRRRNFEQTLGVLVADFVEVGGAERERVKKTATDFGRAEGIVDGEEDAIGADDLKRAEERRGGEVSAGGDVDVRMEGFGVTAAELVAAAGEDGVSAGEGVGQVFAHVADDELEAGEAIEEAGGDEAENVHASFDMPAPASGGEHKAEVFG